MINAFVQAADGSLKDSVRGAWGSMKLRRVTKLKRGRKTGMAARKRSQRISS